MMACPLCGTHTLPGASTPLPHTYPLARMNPRIQRMTRRHPLRRPLPPLPACGAALYPLSALCPALQPALLLSSSPHAWQHLLGLAGS